MIVVDELRAEPGAAGYTAGDLDGLRAVLFGDGSMMLAHGATALHLSAKQATELAAFLARLGRPR